MTYYKVQLTHWLNESQYHWR